MVDETIKPIIESAFSCDSYILPDLAILVRGLRDSEQKNFLKSYLKFIANKEIDIDGGWQSSGSEITTQTLPALSFLTGKLLEENKLLKELVMAHLTSASGIVTENGIFTFRILMSSLSSDMGELAFKFAWNIAKSL